MNIIKYKNIFIIISSILVVIGLVLIFLIKPTFGIDFTGGTLVEFKSGQPIKIEEVRKKIGELYSGKEILIQESGTDQFILRGKVQTESDYKKFEEGLLSTLPDTNILRHESIGASVGASLTRKAITGIVIASLLIIGYLAYAFRSASKSVSSWSFGTIAIITLLHDLIVSFAAYTVIGSFAGYEVESMIVVAALTIMGFSVHDTIVVFDRIRENMIKHPGLSISENSNNAINQTIARSLNTSLTVIVVLVALLILGGGTIKPFVLMLILGIGIGTYSSIFVASPVLAWWIERKRSDQ
ncbi:MAG: protein translocase subunit SecF [bacterium]